MAGEAEAEEKRRKIGAYSTGPGSAAVDGNLEG